MQLAVNNQVISEEEVQQVIALKSTLKQLKKQVESISSSLSHAESVLVEKLEAGASSPFGFSLAVKEVARKFPAWKEYFISRLGKNEADKVLESVEPKIYKNLTVKAA